MKKMIDFIKKIYIKYKEVVNYLIVGGLTTLISVSSYALFRQFINNYMISTSLSWIIAVSFAYIANRIFVFESKNKGVLLEIIKFFGCRLFSLGSEIIVMYILVDLLKINDMISKVIVQFVVLMLNYVFSKIIVFKK
ncbi:MAG: GtrA family protein [bacterium]|nr:GtrA family protein [bacterium]